MSRLTLLTLLASALVACSPEPPQAAGGDVPGGTIASASSSALAAVATSPEGAFELALAASARQDDLAFHATLAPASQARQAHAVLLAAAAAAVEAEGPEGELLRQRLIGIGARHGVRTPAGAPDPERVLATVEALEGALERSEPALRASLYAELCALVRERSPARLPQVAGLEGFQRSGESARGVLVLRDVEGEEQRQPVRFREHEGGWRLELEEGE